MKIGNVKKVLLPNLPYLFFLWAFLKLGTAYRLAPGADFAHKLIDGEISINHRILKRKFSGRGFENLELQKILMKERKAIRDAGNEKGFCIIKKEQMIKYVGHSPDFMEAILYREYFNIKPQQGKQKFTIRFL